jgi:choline dehydrogenase-like flavoprotein
MIVDSAELPRGVPLVAEVCVIGAGPAGIVTSLELADRGFSVILLESGTANPRNPAQALSKAELDTSRHAPLHQAVSRQLGGTSALWGGRCIPLDPIDFAERPASTVPGWPIPYEEVAARYPKACAYTGCGASVFDARTALTGDASIVPGLPDGEVRSSTIERWASPANFGKMYEKRLRKHDRVRLVLDATCTSINFADTPARVSDIAVRSMRGNSLEVKAQHYIICAGGLETTRLLLNSDAVHRDGVGNDSGNVGRYYMGHLSGKIADIQFTTDPDKTIYQFEKDSAGVYCRRRLTVSAAAQREHGLLNCALFLDNPALNDARHKNGILSFAYLALTAPLLNRFLAPEAIVQAARGAVLPGQTRQHFYNVMADAKSVATFVPRFGYQRYLARRRIPGFFLKSATNRYSLHYHAEQAPHADSRVSLSDQRDALGLRQLRIDLKFTPEDAASVLSVHRLIDSHLRQHRCGHLIYRPGNLEDLVLRQARDGFHQIGTTRMSRDPRHGVVDPDCTVHGVENLSICSSSVFPRSGQANPTLTIVALGIRLAEHLAEKRLAA